MAFFKKEKTTQTTDGVILRTMLSEFNRSLILIADKDLLVANTISKIKQIIPVKQILFYLLQQDTDQYRLWGQHDGEIYTVFKPHDKLINWLSVNETFLIVSESANVMTYFSDKEQRMIQTQGIDFIYPLKVMNRMSGVVLLGKRTDGYHFSNQDIDLLTLLLDQAAFAIENTALYEDQSARVKKMYRADRLAILGQLAAGAAHEIRNPLTAIRSTVQYLGKGIEDPEKLEMVHELMEEVDRINKIVQGMLSFSKPSELETTKVDIEHLLQQSLMLLNSVITKQHVQVCFNIQVKNTIVIADAAQLKQVFLNLILNAVEAMEDCVEKRLTLIIESGRVLDFQSRYLLISITDTGKGIAEEDTENIFNPFYTTKKDGTGLGLPISYGIITRHSGEMEATSLPGAGTTVVIKLPQLI